MRLQVRLATPFRVADGGITLHHFLSELLGITTGFAGNALPKLLLTMGLVQFPVYLDPVLIGAVISIAVVLIVSRFTEITAKKRDYRLSLLKTPSEEIDEHAARKTMRFGYTMIIFAIGKTAILLYFYEVPYFRALNPSGQIAAKGWLRGEGWFAYSWLILYFILGCLALRWSGGVIVPSE